MTVRDEARCAICGEPPNRHNGLEKFCPMYATYRPAAPKLDEGVIAEVKEALRPFAREARSILNITGDDEHITADDFDACELTVGDFRNARRLLTLIEGGGE